MKKAVTPCSCLYWVEPEFASRPSGDHISADVLVYTFVFFSISNCQTGYNQEYNNKANKKIPSYEHHKRDQRQFTQRCWR